MKTKLTMLASILTSMIVMTQAYAQEASLAKEPTMNAGVRMMMLPTGSVAVASNGEKQSSTTAFAFGVSPHFDYNLIKYFSVGIGPDFIFNVNGKDSQGDSSNLINLNARLKGTVPILEALDAYVLVTPGFSVLIRPGERKSAKGFAMGILGGANYKINRRFGMYMEAGYQLGFQKASESVQQYDVDFNGVNFFMLNLGAQAYF